MAFFNYIGHVYYIAVLIAVLIGLNDFFNQINRIEKNARYYSLFSASRVVLTLSILMSTFYLDGKVEVDIVFLVILTSSVLSFAATFYYFYENSNISRETYSSTRKTRLESVFFRYGFPLTISLIVSFFILNTDKYLILYFWDHEGLGLYSSVQMLIQFGVNMIISSFSVAWNPHVFNLVKEKGTLYALATHKKNSKYYFVFFILATFFIMLFGGLLLNLINVNNEFSRGVNLLVIFLSFFVLYFKVYYIDLFFQIENKAKSILYNNFFIMVLNIILGLVLIPALGPLGGAFSTLISVAFFILYFYFSKSYYVGGGNENVVFYV